MNMKNIQDQRNMMKFIKKYLFKRKNEKNSENMRTIVEGI